MQRKSLLFTHKTGGFAAASGFMVFVYFCMQYSISIENPPYPTKQEQIIVPQNSVLVLVQAG